MSWAHDTVTVIRRTVVGQDARGNDVYGETRIDYDRCRVQPVSSTAVLDNPVRITSHLRVFGPPGMDVAATDNVEYQGTRYEVDGEPARWGSPTGRLAHVEVLLRRVTG